ncbi:MAG: cysteine desulfurase NifS [Candidatus Diapherotrites archaeon]|nr:cysteine desulfurase NifS [Candidatus Diapherotrites archaeon]
METRDIYLDHAATTYVLPEVKSAMDPYFCERFGNPSAFNSKGLKAKGALRNARKTVAELINALPLEVYFVGSGTESDNLAIKGVARANKEKGRHIITCKIEHHAVLDSCKALEKDGYEVTYLDVDKYGQIRLNDLKKAIRNDTILITIMYANNEIGTIEPIKEISKIAKEKGILFHTDACQAGGQLSIDVKELGVDLMTLNGSKLYGPKGIGLLYVRDGVKIEPIIHGGGQEKGLRSGTENIPSIVGFAKALELAQTSKDEESKRLILLRDKLKKGLLEIPKTLLNGHPTERLPNNLNIAFADVEGESIILRLDALGIYVSTGSACTSKTLEASYVVTATGMPDEIAHGSVRFSLGHRTTEEDIDYVLDVLPKIIEELRNMSPVEVDLEKILEEWNKNE